MKLIAVVANRQPPRGRVALLRGGAPLFFLRVLPETHHSKPETRNLNCLALAWTILVEKSGLSFRPGSGSWVYSPRLRTTVLSTGPAPPFVRTVRV